MWPPLQPGVSPTRGAGRGAVSTSTLTMLCAGAGAGWCTRGAGGAGHDTRCAHAQGEDECIHGVLLGQARAGQGQDGARTSARLVPEQCRNRTRHQPPDHPDIRHLTSDIRHPRPVMYPRYIVTQCRPFGDLLLLYPILAKVSVMGTRMAPAPSSN